MQLINPLPLHCVFIVLLLPAIWFAGFNLASRATDDPRLRYWLTPGVSLALWLLSTQLIGQLSASFTTGLWGASILIALIGSFHYLAARKIVTKEKNEFDSQHLSSRMMWFSAIASTLFISAIALYWHFHDEFYVTGHLAIISQIQNDAFPPINMTFPDEPLKYHYGFDLFAAILSALFRWPVDLSIDIATMILWVYSWCLLWILGEKTISKSKGFLLPLIMLFGGGLPFFGVVTHQGEPILARLLGLTSVDGNLLNPPVVSYFFQHPWALGIPLTICILLLTLGRNNQQNYWRYGVLTLLFVTLSFSHVVLFLTIFGSFLLAELFRDATNYKRQFTYAMFLLCCVMVAVFLVGGFFQYSSDSVQNLISLRPGAFNTSSTYIEWYLLNFGLLLPFGIAGLFYLKSDRIFFVTLLTGSLIVFNFFDYKLSYDIVKFANITTMALSFLSSVTLAKLFNKSSTLMLKISGAFALMVMISIGFSFTLVSGLKLKGSPLEESDKALIKLSTQDISAVNWLRKNIHQKDMVLRMRPIGIGYAQWGGIAQPWIGTGGLTFGFSEEKLILRSKLQASLPPGLDDYQKVGVRWFVLAPWDKPFDRYIQQWLDNGRVKLRVEFTPLKIYELLPKTDGLKINDNN